MRSNARELAWRSKVGSAAGANQEAADPGGLCPPISQAPLRDVAAGVVGVTAAAPEDALTDRLSALTQISLADLRREWRRLFRLDPPRLSRDLMTRALAHRLQEVAHGGMAKATERRLSAVAEKFEGEGAVAPSPGPRIKPGSRLVREWHGRTHTVEVTHNGFAYGERPIDR